MRPRTSLLASLLGVAGVAVAIAALARADEDEDAHEPAALFAASCALCHEPPDPAFYVDRVWIEHLETTA